MSLITLNLGFFAAEARQFIGGPTAFMLALTRKADAMMFDAGGIKPFVYTCSYEGFGSHFLRVEEIGRALRTDAQRALVKARARSRRKPTAQPSSRRPARSA